MFSCSVSQLQCAHNCTYCSSQNFKNIAMTLPALHQKGLFAMFHAKIDKDKAKLMDSVQNPAGACQVLFCRIVFGMGVDIPDIRTVIHYIPSADVDEYMQEAGHAEMGSTGSNAILYCYPGCTLGHVSPAMKRYTINDDVCRHSLLLQSFGGCYDMTQLHIHSCGDVSTRTCVCASPCSYQPVRAEESPWGMKMRAVMTDQ